MVNDAISFERVVAIGCGLDVHKNSVVATVGGIGIQEETRSFGTFTVSLERLDS